MHTTNSPQGTAIAFFGVTEPVKHANAFESAVALLGPFPVSPELPAPVIAEGLMPFSAGEITHEGQAAEVVRSLVAFYAHLLQIDSQSPRAKTHIHRLDRISRLSNQLADELAKLSPPERDIVARPGPEISRFGDFETPKVALKQPIGLCIDGLPLRLLDVLPRKPSLKAAQTAATDGFLVQILKKTGGAFTQLATAMKKELTDDGRHPLDAGGSTNISRLRKSSPKQMLTCEAWEVFERCANVAHIVAAWPVPVPRTNAPAGAQAFHDFLLQIHEAATGEEVAGRDLFAQEIKLVAPLLREERILRRRMSELRKEAEPFVGPLEGTAPYRIMTVTDHELIPDSMRKEIKEISTRQVDIMLELQTGMLGRRVIPQRKSIGAGRFVFRFVTPSR